MSIDIIKNSINNNLINKLKTIKGIEYPINHDMIEEIEIKNIKSIAYRYKNIKLIGNKFNIKVKQDDSSQEIVKVAIAVGLLEKISLGYGYCIYK